MKFAVEVKKGFVSVATGTVLAASLGMSSLVVASDLTPQDLMVKTIFDKSIISGAVEHNGNDLVMNMSYKDKDGNPYPHVNFKYDGTIVSVDTDRTTGELVDTGKPIGTIEGTAVFPIDFVYMSAGMNAVANGMPMDQMLAMFGGMPPVVKWTCEHCKMVVGDTTYVSIVDAIDPNGPYKMGPMFEGLAGGAEGAVDAMRLDGRAFTGETPVSFDPNTYTMSLSLAGCSAVVGVEGTNAGMIGTLCMNSTATFDVSNVNGHLEDVTNPAKGPIVKVPDPSDPDNTIEQQFVLDSTFITATGSSNCTTVLHYPMAM